MKSILRLDLTAVLALTSLFVSGLMTDIPLATASEKTKVVIVMGESQIKSNLSGAREAAIADCLAAAVKNAAIGELPCPC